MDKAKITGEAQSLKGPEHQSQLWLFWTTVWCEGWLKRTRSFECLTAGFITKRELQKVHKGLSKQGDYCWISQLFSTPNCKSSPPTLDSEMPQTWLATPRSVTPRRVGDPHLIPTPTVGKASRRERKLPRANKFSFHKSPFFGLHVAFLVSSGWVQPQTSICWNRVNQYLCLLDETCGKRGS